MTTTISADGLLRIPELFRQTDSIEPGQRFDIERLGRGEYRVKAETPVVPEKESWLTILRECPDKDWWSPTDRSQMLIARDVTRLFADDTEDDS